MLINGWVEEKLRFFFFVTRGGEPHSPGRQENAGAHGKDPSVRAMEAAAAALPLRLVGMDWSKFSRVHAVLPFGRKGGRMAQRACFRAITISWRCNHV
jgi:hypothetical protein